MKDSQILTSFDLATGRVELRRVFQYHFISISYHSRVFILNFHFLLIDMARATRSAAAVTEKDKQADLLPPPIRKPGAKKRKRTSFTENGDQPAAKHLRGDIKEEDSQEQEGSPGITKPTETLGSGDVPLQASDAEKILDILEVFVLFYTQLHRPFS